jgi:hypothetical protein
LLFLQHLSKLSDLCILFSQRILHLIVLRESLRHLRIHADCRLRTWCLNAPQACDRKIDINFGAGSYSRAYKFVSLFYGALVDHAAHIDGLLAESFKVFLYVISKTEDALFRVECVFLLV